MQRVRRLRAVTVVAVVTWLGFTARLVLDVLILTYFSRLQSLGFVTKWPAGVSLLFVEVIPAVVGLVVCGMLQQWRLSRESNKEQHTDSPRT